MLPLIRYLGKAERAPLQRVFELQVLYQCVQNGADASRSATRLYSHPNGATVRVCIDQSQKDCVDVQKGTFEGRGASCSCTSLQFLVHRVVHLAPRISKVPLFNAHTLFSGLVYSDGSHKISNVEARGRRNLLERKHKTTPTIIILMQSHKHPPTHTHTHTHTHIHKHTHTHTHIITI